MIDNFPAFSKAINDRLVEMSQGELYTVDVSDLFAVYLSAFPEGTNPMFRERSEHDCNCCKQFVRRLGNIVSIRNGVRETLWDVADLPAPYDIVAARLHDVVQQAPITSVFRTQERQSGTQFNYDDQTGQRWDHFFGRVADRHFSTEAATVCGKIKTDATVFRRGLDTFRMDDFETVVDLIDSNGLYRGAEFRPSVVAFRTALSQYQTCSDRGTFVWEHVDNNAKFRNTAIGTLMDDLSGGLALDDAVRKFESKVAPENYKRPTAVITEKMVTAAVGKLRELGLEAAVDRRYAEISDVSVNDILFVDNRVAGQMRDGITDTLMAAVVPRAVDLDHAREITIEDFVQTVLPRTRSLKAWVRNSHLGNFVSLTAPSREDTGRLFRWSNDFAWSYDGEVADSVKQRVKAAGGNTNAVMRVSLAWFNFDDLDIHVREPDGTHVFFGNRANKLDVDMNISPTRRDAVENVSWTGRLKDGDYQVSVHNYTKRESIDVGFTLEVEFGGRISQYQHAAAVAAHKEVTALTLTVKDNRLTGIRAHQGVRGGMTSSEKWGVTTETQVGVDTVMLSPNHWGDNHEGNKHWIFILEQCKNPDSTRGIYNEFLRPELNEHRKVFEVLGARMKCPPSDRQLSGLGFTAGRGDEVCLVTDGRDAYRIVF